MVTCFPAAFWERGSDHWGFGDLVLFPESFVAGAPVVWSQPCAGSGGKVPTSSVVLFHLEG